MKLSARNVLKGKVTSITTGVVAAEVQVDIGGGNTITSTITDNSVERLGQKVGQETSPACPGERVAGSSMTIDNGNRGPGNPLAVSAAV